MCTTISNSRVRSTAKLSFSKRVLKRINDDSIAHELFYNARTTNVFRIAIFKQNIIVRKVCSIGYRVVPKVNMFGTQMSKSRLACIVSNDSIAQQVVVLILHLRFLQHAKVRLLLLHNVFESV